MILSLEKNVFLKTGDGLMLNCFLVWNIVWKKGWSQLLVLIVRGQKAILNSLSLSLLFWYSMMKRILKEDLIYEILSVVEEIPEGQVATYGQIAKLIGREKNARLVGKVLSMAQYYGDYPCHRVVNHAGRLVLGWKEQGDLLRQEGVLFKDETCVDLKQCQWHC